MRQAIRLIFMLPPESATSVQMHVDPQNRPTSSRRRKGDAWREVYHRQSKDVVMDLWELQAAKAANSGGRKGARKKTPRYPDPTRKK